MDLFLGLIWTAAIIAIPLGLLVALARSCRSMWISVATTCIAVPLQLLGLTSTCTQGADGTFYTGAVLSTPFLVSAICSILWARNKRRTVVIAGTLTAAVSLAMIALTRNAWLGALLYGTPCGEFFAGYGSKPVMRGIVVAGYLALPSLLIAYAVRAIARAWMLTGSAR